MAGYELRGRRLYKNDKLCYYVVGQIHTHQNRSLNPSPSYYTNGGSSYGDLGFSLYHDSLPVFTIGHDNKIYGIRGYRDASNHVIGLLVSMNPNDSLRQNLLNGTTSLYRIIQNLPRIKK